MKAALIVDHGSIARWQRDALMHCGDRLEVVAVLDCTNTRTRRRPFAHFVYYLINVLVMRGPWRASVPLPDTLHGVPVLRFASEYDGLWQRIPDDVAAAARALGAEVAIKFGMNLLADPDGLAFDHGVLSYHHGDPASYRGRPAGFYELYEEAAYQGIVVQRISNRLDGGTVVARARSKVHRHSYRATLANAYANSVPMLGRAVSNLAAGRTEVVGVLGRNYRLPSNAKALAFVGKLAWRKLRRYAYGALFEKRWRVGFASLHVADALAAGPRLSLAAEVVPCVQRRHVFYADPFPLGRGQVVVEALNRRSGVGELVVLDRAGERPPVRLELDGHHYSYPCVVEDGGRSFLLPEVAYWSPPFLLELSADRRHVVGRQPLQGMERRPLVDPTHLEHGGIHYVFGGHHGSELDCLHAYVSGSLAGPYRPHPANPVVVDPGTARMGGGFVRHDGRLYRIGQDNTRAYGDGITVLEVVTLTPSEYDERPVREVRVRTHRGPHTLNFVGDSVVFDFYRERFAAGAGLRRFLAKLKVR